MVRKICWRFLIIVITMLLVSAFVFLLQDFSLGDSSAFFLSEDASDDAIASYREAIGLEENIFKRYFTFLYSFITFQWGNTLSGQDIKEVLSQRFPITIAISLLSLMMALVISVPWTLMATKNKDSFADSSSSIFVSIMLAFPSFLIALFLSVIFSYFLGWFPIAGYIPFSVDFLSALKSIFLPSLTLALMHSSLFIRVLKEALLDNLNRPYTLSLKAQGGKPLELLLHSALKPSLPVFISLICQSLASSFAGAAIVESVFALPGIGSLLVNATLSRDSHLSGIVIMVIAFIVSSLYMLAGIVSSLIDPRLKEEL